MLYSLISLDCISSLSWTLIVLYYILLYMKYFYLFLLKHIFLSCLLAYKHLEMKNYCSSLLGRRHRHPTPVLLSGQSLGWRSLVGCSPWGRWELDMTELLHFHFSFSCIGEGNGNSLQCSCQRIPGMEEPSMGSHSRTRLKWLSSSSSGNISLKHVNQLWQKRRKALAWVGTESEVCFILSIFLAGSDWD